MLAAEHILIDISLISSASLRSQWLSQLNEHNPALEPACPPCFAEAPQRRSGQVYRQLSIFDQRQNQAEATPAPIAIGDQHSRKPWTLAAIIAHLV